MDLYLVRHGESNIPHDAAQSDYPLSDLGHEQARQLARRFHGMQIDRLIATPYQRTRETAAAIAAATGVETIEEPGLSPIDTGEIQRVSFSRRKERWPDYYAKPVSPLMDFGYFGGESAAAFAERVTGAFVENIWEKHWREQSTLVVVCHG